MRTKIAVYLPGTTPGAGTKTFKNQKFCAEKNLYSTYNFQQLLFRTLCYGESNIAALTYGYTIFSVFFLIIFTMIE